MLFSVPDIHNSPLRASLHSHRLQLVFLFLCNSNIKFREYHRNEPVKLFFTAAIYRSIHVVLLTKLHHGAVQPPWLPL